MKRVFLGLVLGTTRSWVALSFAEVREAHMRKLFAGLFALVLSLVAVVPRAEAAPQIQTVTEATTAQWWNWMASTDPPGLPSTDPTGAVYNTHGAQPGNQFFVAGAFSPQTRTYNVPHGYHLIFPIVNIIGVINGIHNGCMGGNTNGPDVASTKACLDKFIPTVKDLFLTVDGTTLLDDADRDPYRVETQPFALHLPIDDTTVLFGAVAGDYEALSDGWWVDLSGLTPGPHTLHFGGTGALCVDVDCTSLFTFTIDTNDAITVVVPEPASLLLLLAGMANLAAVATVLKRR